MYCAYRKREQRPRSRSTLSEIRFSFSLGPTRHRRIIRAAMSKPPFRKGVDPLFDVGLLDKTNNPLFKFFWDCEKMFLENQALRHALKKAGGNPEGMRIASPGSPGFHRKVFDKKYREIADYERQRLASLPAKHSGSKYGPN